MSNSDRKNENRAGAKALRWFLIAAGLLCTGLGILGIFLPLLPTVPLLLLAAACFARSSEKFHAWLIEHERLGPMIEGFLAGEGIPRKAKRSAILLLWLTITPSALLLVPLTWIRILLFAIAAGVTLYLIRLPVRDID